MKKITIFLLLLLSFTTFADIPEKPATPRLCNDFIGLIPQGESDNIEQILLTYEEKTGIQIAVVVINEVTTTIEDDAQDLFEKWGIGKKGLDNGVLFLIAKESRKMRIHVGYGVDKYLPEAFSKRIIEQVVKPHFKTDDYVGGIYAGVQSMIDYMGTAPLTERKEQEERLQKEVNAKFQENLETFGLWATLIAIISGILTVCIVLIKKSARVKKAVREMKKYYKNILDDEVFLETGWPEWAKKEFNQNVSLYRTEQIMCGDFVKKLPSIFFTRIFTNEGRLLHIQEELKRFDEVDQKVTKIREDVKFYKKNARGAVVQTMKALDDLKKIMPAPEAKYNFKKQEEKLRSIENDTKKLTANILCDDRSVYLGAYALIQSIATLHKEISEEIEAHHSIGSIIDKKNEYVNEADKKIAQLARLWKTMREYPRTAWSDLITVEQAESFKSYLISKFKSANEIISKNTIDKLYTTALVEITKGVEYDEKISKAITDIETRLHDLQVKDESYFKVKGEAESAIAEAEKVVLDKDVSDATHTLLKSAKEHLKSAKALTNRQKADMILVHSLLVKSKKDADKAYSEAKEDIRKEKPSYSSNRKNDDGYISTASTISIGGFGGGHSGGGGSFGGFGGGHSGGGGASGSW